MNIEDEFVEVKEIPLSLDRSNLTSANNPAPAEDPTFGYGYYYDWFNVYKSVDGECYKVGSARTALEAKRIVRNLRREQMGLKPLVYKPLTADQRNGLEVWNNLRVKLPIWAKEVYWTYDSIFDKYKWHNLPITTYTDVWLNRDQREVERDWSYEDADVVLASPIIARRHVGSFEVIITARGFVQKHSVFRPIGWVME